MSKDTNISAQTAAKAAAELYQGTGDADGAMTAMQRFYKGILTLGGDPSEVPAGAIQQATQNLAAQGIQGTVARDLSNDEGRWRDALENNPGDWYNNVGDARASSGGGKGPDFKFKDDSQNVSALWLNGKYGPAPAWVFEKLGLPFPAGGGQQPAPQAPAADQGQQNPVPF